MTPAGLLAASAAVYAGCRTYRDRGRVATRFRRPNGRPDRAGERPFATAFVRPHRFRFEFRGKSHPAMTRWQRYLVHADADAVRTWWDVTPGVRTAASLSLALAGATGVSGGSAHTVPSLLLPDQINSRRRWADLLDLEHLPAARVGRAVCHRVRGRYPADPPDPETAAEVLRVTGRRMGRVEPGPVTLWLDANTLLLRRIEQTTRFETFTTEETTDYLPAADGPVSEHDLRFDPPAAG